MNLNDESKYFNFNKLYALTCSIKGDYKNAEIYFQKAGFIFEAYKMKKIYEENLFNSPLRIIYKSEKR
jgi:hypothetical protein